MAIGDVPAWITTVGPLIGTVVVGGMLAWAEKRKGHAPPPPGGDTGTQSVVAAYFFDKDLVRQFRDTVAEVLDQVKELNGHMVRAAQERHDERLLRDKSEHDALTAAVKALADSANRQGHG